MKNMAYPYAVSAPSSGLDFAKLAEQYGKLTVREITSGTSGLALAQLVAARAAIQLATLVDARRFSRTELVPPGGGKTYHFQRVAVPASSFEGALTEGTDLTAADVTLGDVTATLTVGAVRTDVSDIAQRQAAVNLAEVIGISHGNALNRFMNNDIYTVLNGNTTSKITGGTANDGKSYQYTFNDIFNARANVEAQRGRPDTMVTFPYAAAVGGGSATGFYPFVMGNITSVQFTTALASYLQTGQISELFGLRLFVDYVYTPSNCGANAAEYAQILQSNECVGFALAEDIISEIQRWAPQVGFRIVTHITGKSALIVDAFTCSIEHA
jgi:hypothetical protein